MPTLHSHRLRTWCMAAACLLMSAEAPLAHHSFSMFDYGLPTELDGTVQEFRYINPHCFIILKAKGADGHVATWTLEGMPPSSLERDGWTRTTLRPGDQIKVTISPLRSGANGGMWTPESVHFRDGRTVAGR
jgi:hypothetical protein